MIKTNLHFVAVPCCHFPSPSDPQEVENYHFIVAEVRNKCNAYKMTGPDPIAEFQTGTGTPEGKFSGETDAQSQPVCPGHWMLCDLVGYLGTPLLRPYGKIFAESWDIMRISCDDIG